MKIPMAEAEEKRGGWMVSYNFLREISEEVRAENGTSCSMEDVEGVIKALLQRGYLKLETI